MQRRCGRIEISRGRGRIPPRGIDERSGCRKSGAVPRPCVDDVRMAWLHDIVFDSRHPASLARFWAGVLDGYEVAPYDEAELERLRGKGIFDPEDDPMVLVERPGGPGPRYLFQLVPESKVVKNRLHLDVRADDLAAELRRDRKSVV